MALQQKLAGNSALYIFPLCVLFVFLVLSALYESWALPLAIILIVPMCMLSAIGGVWLRNMDNNIFTQIGFVVLVGLACKNAILIVEFAKQIQDPMARIACRRGRGLRPRLRPILMTSFAFILGVLPLVISSGAGLKCARRLARPSSSGCSVSPFGLFSPRVLCRHHVVQGARHQNLRARTHPIRVTANCRTSPFCTLRPPTI